MIWTSDSMSEGCVHLQYNPGDYIVICHNSVILHDSVHAIESPPLATILDWFTCSPSSLSSTTDLFRIVFCRGLRVFEGDWVTEIIQKWADITQIFLPLAGNFRSPSPHQVLTAVKYGIWPKYCFESLSYSIRRGPRLSPVSQHNYALPPSLP